MSTPQRTLVLNAIGETVPESDIKGADDRTMRPMDDHIAEQLEAMRGRLEWTEEHMKALEAENEQLRAENEQLRTALADTQALAELAYNEANRGYLTRLFDW